MESPARPTRRAAASRRKIVVESDEEDVEMKVESEEEFTPAPKNTRQSARPKTTVEVTATPKIAPRSRRTRLTDSVEPSQIFTPAEDVTPTPAPDPIKKAASPRKRAGRPSVRAN